ncbi:helix-turn-helix transcriptional regulator [Pseudothauera nasutitermitis]|uniref:Helix-turn-helix transcriptional regulator n=1 Tax=Pseudothauera nasutitermitis TaxID=2565930 RepID=A0A4S4AXH5_9RHOO|nr:AraC family transcriptional regulator [Pseudothauera nasutitermitis]THF64802.1 helix-turn-helix transcriptional regulator [Pseudothauera nasutitermitis]
MEGIAGTTSGQPALDPSKLEEDGLTGVREDWRHAMHVYQPCEGLHISCINGRPGSKWDFRAEGPPAFSVNILLEGRIQTAFDDGAVLNAQASSAILMASGQHTSGWDVLDGKSDGIFRMVSIHMPQTAMDSLTGLQMDNLRKRVCTIAGDQPHIDAFLGVAPASSSLQRVAYDLLGFGCTYPGPCISRDLYLRAKALEAIACFLRENLAQQEMTLPVPADRPRLIEARALLERTYGEDWSVQSLARVVGLNEKRLQSGFQALFGCSVHACLTRIRIDAAVTLLQRGISVTETASTVGFANLSHFSRVFRSHTGISPKQCALGISPRVQPQPADDASRIRL